MFTAVTLAFVFFFMVLLISVGILGINKWYYFCKQ